MTSVRSYLYVPGNRPDRFERALESGADAVILDLEDAVPLDAKDRSRQNVIEFASESASGSVELWARINTGARGIEDLQALSEPSALTGIVVPKAVPETLAEVVRLAPRLEILALVESARGLTLIDAIAASGGVRTVALGEVDLAADLGLIAEAGAEPDDAALWPLRMRLVLAAAATSRLAPIGPVHTNIRDIEALVLSTRRLRRAGFGARQAIHPAQVATINAAFTPSDAEFDAASDILQLAAAAGGNVVVDADGRMVDEAVLRSARQIVAMRPPER